MTLLGLATVVRAVVLSFLVSLVAFAGCLGGPGALDPGVDDDGIPVPLLGAVELTPLFTPPRLIDEVRSWGVKDERVLKALADVPRLDFLKICAQGAEVSVLVGDCLFAHALEMAAAFPTTEVCRAVSRATKTVCTGEILQTQRRRQPDLARAEYFKLLEMKTAELFALSCELGAALAGATM